MEIYKELIPKSNDELKLRKSNGFTVVMMLIDSIIYMNGQAKCHAPNDQGHTADCLGQLHEMQLSVITQWEAKIGASGAKEVQDEVQKLEQVLKNQKLTIDIVKLQSVENIWPKATLDLRRTVINIKNGIDRTHNDYPLGDFDPDPSKSSWILRSMHVLYGTFHSAIVHLRHCNDVVCLMDIEERIRSSSVLAESDDGHCINVYLSPILPHQTLLLRDVTTDEGMHAILTQLKEFTEANDGNDKYFPIKNVLENQFRVILFRISRTPKIEFCRNRMIEIQKDIEDARRMAKLCIRRTRPAIDRCVDNFLSRFDEKLQPSDLDLNSLRANCNTSHLEDLVAHMEWDLTLPKDFLKEQVREFLDKPLVNGVFNLHHWFKQLIAFTRNTDNVIIDECDVEAGKRLVNHLEESRTGIAACLVDRLSEEHQKDCLEPIIDRSIIVLDQIEVDRGHCPASKLDTLINNIKYDFRIDVLKLIEGFKKNGIYEDQPIYVQIQPQSSFLDTAWGFLRSYFPNR